MKLSFSSRQSLRGRFIGMTAVAIALAHPAIARASTFWPLSPAIATPEGLSFTLSSRDLGFRIEPVTVSAPFSVHKLKNALSHQEENPPKPEPPGGSR